jgi:outer membrane protein
VFSISVISFAALSGFSADGKIAFVDLRKVFDGYYKTKQADLNLKEEASELDKQRKDMIDSFKKSEEDWKKLIDKTNDQAISSEERDKSKKSAEQKLQELREMEQTIGQFNRSATAKLGEKQRRKREQVLQEIREVINVKAKNARASYRPKIKKGDAA